MTAKALAATAMTTAAATAVAVYPATQDGRIALAAGLFSALLARIALAVVAPAPVRARGNPRRP